MTLRPIATTPGDFPDLRKSGCIYVDKTAHFPRLVSDKEVRRHPSLLMASLAATTA